MERIIVYVSKKKFKGIFFAVAIKAAIVRFALLS